MAEQSIAERLRAPCKISQFNSAGVLETYEAYPSPIELEAADEIDRLTKERDAARLGRDILRQQLRDAGIEPLITE